MKLLIKVKGMVCNGCENRVQNALKRIQGVEDVVADYKEELVTVNTSKEIDKSLIYEKVEDLGFEVIKED